MNMSPELVDSLYLTASLARATCYMLFAVYTGSRAARLSGIHLIAHACLCMTFVSLAYVVYFTDVDPSSRLWLTIPAVAGATAIIMGVLRGLAKRIP